MENARIYVDNMSGSSRARRLIWRVVYLLLFRPTPRFLLEGWRLFLLRLFGARIGRGSRVAPSCFVWAPWNLTMGVYVCLGDEVNCYTQDKVELGDYSTVSQGSFLCTASHDIRYLSRPLTTSPISVLSHAWIGAEAFVGPGVEIGEGAVVGARCAAFRDVAPWTIVAGNPAREIGVRRLVDGIEIGPSAVAPH